MKKLLSIILAAVMAMTMLVIPAGAEEETGYWKFSGTTAWINYSSVEPTVKKSKLEFRPTPQCTFIRKYAISGGQLEYSQTEDKHWEASVNGEKVQMYGKYNKVVSSFTEPAQYYFPKDPINISVTIKGECSSFAGTIYDFPYTWFQPGFYFGDTDWGIDGSGVGARGSGFGDKANNNYYAIVLTKPGTAKGTMSSTIPEHSDTIKNDYKDMMHISFFCNDMTIVYNYKWTKGTPAKDEGTGHLGITLKKGESIQLWIDDSSKVTYSTSKKSVAAITSSGKVTAKAKGTAVITIKYGSNSQKVKIKVTA